MSGIPAMNKANNNTSGAKAIITTSNRMYSADIDRFIKRFTDRVPANKVYRIPFRMPQAMYTLFRMIEQVICQVHTKEEADALVIDQASTIGLPQEIIDDLTAKMFELANMIDNADSELEGVFHVSKGSLENVGMSVLRRCFYVAHVHNTPQIGNQPEPSYPYIEVKNELREYLCSLFMRIYAKGLTKQLFPLYAAGCLQFCCYTEFVGFNVANPNCTYWQTYYNDVFSLIKQSSIPTPDDRRYWMKRGYQPRRYVNKRNNNNQQQQDQVATTEEVQPNANN